MKQFFFKNSAYIFWLTCFVYFAFAQIDRHIMRASTKLFFSAVTRCEGPVFCAIKTSHPQYRTVHVFSNQGPFKELSPRQTSCPTAVSYREVNSDHSVLHRVPYMSVCKYRLQVTPYGASRIQWVLRHCVILWTFLYILVVTRVNSA